MVKKIWAKNILAHKNFGSKNILGQKFWDKKKFGSKRFGSEIVLFKRKKQVGLTQGGGYMTPPQKIVGLKLCWIVVSFAW